MSNHTQFSVEKIIKRARSRAANAEGAAESTHKVAAPCEYLRNKVVEIYDHGQLGSCTATMLLFHIYFTPPMTI